MRVGSSLQEQELHRLHQDGEPLGTLLPATPTIYMWKLRLRDEQLVAHEPERTLRQLIRLTKFLQGRTQPISTSHGLTLLGIEMCGAGLPENGKRPLAKFLAQRKNSRWMINYLENLDL